MKMSYRCPAIHVYKDDYVLSGDGVVKIYLKHCCSNVVTMEDSICKTHANRMKEKYQHTQLCQWNYAYNHGLIYGPQNPSSNIMGDAWYNFIVATRGAPKAGDLEKLEKAEAVVRYIAGTMQKKITDYSITPYIIKKPASTTSLDSLASPKTPRPSHKRIDSKKKGIKKTDIDSASTSTASSTSSISTLNKIPEHKRVFIPKGAINTYERNCRPLTIESVEYVDEL